MLKFNKYLNSNMEELISRYRRELNERISLKKTLTKTNEQIILDNFKYFDLTSSNYCNANEFIKANERIGVKMRNKDELFKALINAVKFVDYGFKESKIKYGEILFPNNMSKNEVF